MRYVLVGLLLLGLAGPALALDEVCITVERVTSTLDDYEFWIAPVTATAASVGCYCQGTCSTAATFDLKDRAGNVISLQGGGSLACATGSSTTTFTTLDTGDGDRVLSAGEGIRFDVANSPTSFDRVTLCVKFTY